MVEPAVAASTGARAVAVLPDVDQRPKAAFLLAAAICYAAFAAGVLAFSVRIMTLSGLPLTPDAIRTLDALAGTARTLMLFLMIGGAAIVYAGLRWAGPYAAHHRAMPRSSRSHKAIWVFMSARRPGWNAVVSGTFFLAVVYLFLANVVHLFLPATDFDSVVVWDIGLSILHACAGVTMALAIPAFTRYRTWRIEQQRKAAAIW
jgi:hypothetical protein